MSGEVEYLPMVYSGWLEEVDPGDIRDPDDQGAGEIVPGVRDILGNIYIVGSAVVYGTTSGRSPVVRIGHVAKITPKPATRVTGYVPLDQLPAEELTDRETRQLAWYREKGFNRVPERAVTEEYVTASVSVRNAANTRFGDGMAGQRSSPLVTNILRFDTPWYTGGRGPDDRGGRP